jgi:hypothetical protein
VKLNLYLLEGIHDDIDFCCKLAKEESVILCPGEMDLICWKKSYLTKTHFGSSSCLFRVTGIPGLNCMFALRNALRKQ